MVFIIGIGCGSVGRVVNFATRRQSFDAHYGNNEDVLSIGKNVLKIKFWALIAHYSIALPKLS